MSVDAGWDGGVLTDLSPQWAERVIFIEECDSTNDEARNFALKGAGDRSVVLSERQMAGRGRRGQAWVCPEGEGVAFSLIIRPQERSALWSRCAVAAGLAVAEALDGYGVSAGVKWPNDVWVGGRKICGILVEAGRDFVVVGVGLNVNVREFPEGLTHLATSLFLEGGEQVSREEVLLSCLQRLDLRLRQIGNGFDDLLETWSLRCVLKGRAVRLEVAGEEKSGKVEGLSPQGELLLRSEVGLEKILQASEIRLV